VTNVLIIVELVLKPENVPPTNVTQVMKPLKKWINVSNVPPDVKCVPPLVSKDVLNVSQVPKVKKKIVLVTQKNTNGTKKPKNVLLYQNETQL
jgi:hypothetical protein